MVAMLMTACGPDDHAAGERLDALERRVEELKAVSVKLHRDQGEAVGLLEKFSTATTKIAASLSAVEIVDSDLNPIAGWWCSGMCYRDARACATNHGTRAPEPCSRQRLAWCAAMPSSRNGLSTIRFSCTSNRETCESLFADCIGAE
jgi:hypothetical protein